MKKLVIFILFIVSALAPFVFGQERQNLTLYVGGTMILSVDDPERIAIGKPEIVDVMKVTQREVTLIGKSKGMTTFIWWDKRGEHSLYIEVYEEDMAEIKCRVDKLIKEADISDIETVALDKENRILLRGEVKGIKNKERFFSALGELRAKIIDLITVREEESSVEIEVQVLELSSDAAKELGFTMSRSLTLREETPISGYSPQTYFKIMPLSRARFNWTLDLLESQGKAKILSRPRLTCRSEREASLMVGGEVPILTTELTEYGAQKTNVDYKEYGITLKIKPTVVDGKKIDIDLDVEISEVGIADVLGSAGSPTAKAYPLIKRAFSTALSLDNGATLSIGGLMREKSEEDIKKFPWLADIPILGVFFRHKFTALGGGEGQRGNRELYITLTPRIISLPGEESIKTEDSAKKIPSCPKIAEGDEKADVSLLEGYMLKKYLAEVRQKILENISYSSPLADKEAKLMLSLKVSCLGEAREAQVIESSGNEIFDEETLKTIKNLSYPPFPQDIHSEEITVEVPIVYQSQEYE